MKKFFQIFSLACIVLLFSINPSVADGTVYGDEGVDGDVGECDKIQIVANGVVCDYGNPVNEFPIILAFTDCISPDMRTSIHAQACNENTGGFRCSDLSNAVEFEPITYACFRNGCEEECYPGAGYQFEEEQIPKCPNP